MPDPTTEIKRYDILAVSQNRAFNVVEHGLKAIINYLQATGLIRVSDEAIAETWTEVYSGVGPTAHELFVKGVNTTADAPFLELTIRTGTRAAPLPFGGTPGEEASFWIAIYGALHPDITGKFKNKIKDILMTRFDFYSRDHLSVPAHAEVPEDERPVDKPKARRGGGGSARVGTAVEEF